MSDPKYKNVGTPAIRAMEECAELQHIICKAIRFGWFNFHPSDEAQTSNRVLTLLEIQDVREAINDLEKELNTP
jgi:hypothetical protein